MRVFPIILDIFSNCVSQYRMSLSCAFFHKLSELCFLLFIKYILLIIIWILISFFLKFYLIVSKTSITFLFFSDSTFLWENHHITITCILYSAIILLFFVMLTYSPLFRLHYLFLLHWFPSLNIGRIKVLHCKLFLSFVIHLLI